MTINELVKELCKREKLKKQVDRAQVKEIVGHLSDITWETYSEKYGLDAKDPKDLDKRNGFIRTLAINGARRAQRKKARAK